MVVFVQVDKNQEHRAGVVADDLDCTTIGAEPHSSVGRLGASLPGRRACASGCR